MSSVESRASGARPVPEQGERSGLVADLDPVPLRAGELHFHNTRGIGLANVMAGLELGVDRYESSFGGIGGCPFAPKATGNICTEDLVYLLEETGIRTGIDLRKLSAIACDVEVAVGHELPRQIMKAGLRLDLHPMDSVRVAQG